MDNIVEFKGVTKSFGKHAVHNGLDLEIPRGKITYIIGPSGTGKSVLLKLMMGLVKKDNGTIIVDGVDVDTIKSKDERLSYRQQFGLVFQNAALFDSMSVYENVAFPLLEHTNLKKSELDAKIMPVLEAVGLSGKEYKMPSELSGGMRKRCGLARALMLEPKVMMYDEPTTGLDPIMTDIVDKLIKNTHIRAGFTSVVVSHDLKSIMTIPDNIVMIYQGKRIAQGDVEFYRTTDNPYVRQFLSSSMEGPIQFK